MQSFVDGAGRKWLVSINCQSIKEVRARCGVDLPALLMDGTLGEFLIDWVKMAEVLYILCAHDDNEMVDEVSFLESMWGDALARARDAFGEAYMAFFPDAPIREAVKQALEEWTRRMREGMKKVTAEVEGTDSTPNGSTEKSVVLQAT
jgi:hypothetical protein